MRPVLSRLTWTVEAAIGDLELRFRPAPPPTLQLPGGCHSRSPPSLQPPRRAATRARAASELTPGKDAGAAHEDSLEIGGVGAVDNTSSGVGRGVPLGSFEDAVEAENEQVRVLPRARGCRTRPRTEGARPFAAAARRSRSEEIRRDVTPSGRTAAARQPELVEEVLAIEADPVGSERDPPATRQAIPSASCASAITLPDVAPCNENAGADAAATGLSPKERDRVAKDALPAETPTRSTRPLGSAGPAAPTGPPHLGPKDWAYSRSPAFATCVLDGALQDAPCAATGQTVTPTAPAAVASRTGPEVAFTRR